ncbi:MarR family winged helix-turn-helix transcriptional regulator [Paenibacillus alginolyticus]|uniref:MarR family winged helix-turn-helix transcriptional regulator n=1 Tax=Paenibacillus alginolyticus TaxID=59839 RepID=A0ABT4GJZ4_9BACL|nr:MarR family winged helix-turn-helix transcriptional regulator [Paenibacillus alginolyticus]MCY9666543.1 MarR family winged helix-turn-helix transcriptional regulator [Paenibacillus alginolyticus]MCY9696508.1 MarR family winged helix-turn-helix transcriptional regulator [Paenibacillus alginolyticus]MEC0144685.1 MarR family winged helix-turn-helix transcriptional regulator [Paenibacillus alginolyticus]
MKQLPQYVNVREVLQLLVRRFGLLQKDGAQCCGVSVVQSHIMYELYKRPNISLNELSEILSIDTSTLSRQVQQLVENNLINRLPDPKDRRYVVLSLTETGEKQYHEIAKTMEEYVLGIFQHVPPEKKEQVLESLQILSDAMSQSPNCCTPPL